MDVRPVNDYARQLLHNLPRGAAWPRDDASIWAQLAIALAQELYRLDIRGQQLLDELDPRTTTELLPEWERMLGLPLRCLVGVDQTIEERRSAVVRQLTAQGGQSRAYFIALAAALGYTVTITEFRPYTVGSPVNQPLYDSLWRFAWRVNVPVAVEKSYWRVTSRVSEPLADWGIPSLECFLRRVSPAHTILLFAYQPGV
jgi:uncharacterized protein YmfQ (DUF2313 family)